MSSRARTILPIVARVTICAEIADAIRKNCAVPASADRTRELVGTRKACCERRRVSASETASALLHDPPGRRRNAAASATIAIDSIAPSRPNVGQATSGDATFAHHATRRADIVPLLIGFGRIGSRADVTRRCLEGLLAYDWPGNLRELQHVARAISGPPRPVEVEPLPGRLRVKIDKLHAVGGAWGDKRPARDEIVAVLAHTEGNVTEAARRLGTHRAQFRRWMEYLGLRKP